MSPNQTSPDKFDGKSVRRKQALIEALAEPCDGGERTFHSLKGHDWLAPKRRPLDMWSGSGDHASKANGNTTMDVGD